MNPKPAPSSDSAAAPGAFPATLWTVVLQAGSGRPDEATHALHTLCLRYDRAIQAWFQRSRPSWLPQDRAEDWAQDFLLFMQQKNPFRHLEHRDSRFRSFLVTCLRNFLRDKLAAELAAKRGTGAEHFPLDESILPAEPEDVAATLDREFALSIHQRVMERIQEDCARRGHGARYEQLHPHILGLQADSSYEQLGQSLQLTANHIKKIVFDLREAYYDLFREEVGEVVRDPQTLDEEMRYLATLLARGANAPL